MRKALEGTHSHLESRRPGSLMSALSQNPGGNLGNCKSSRMVCKEIPIHKYFSGPQNYNPGMFRCSSGRSAMPPDTWFVLYKELRASYHDTGKDSILTTV